MVQIAEAVESLYKAPGNAGFIESLLGGAVHLLCGICRDNALYPSHVLRHLLPNDAGGEGNGP